jgi:hypothetical protein
MLNCLEIKSVEEVRRGEGIDDVDTRQEVGGLGVGDFAKRTLWTTGTKSFAGETLVIWDHPHWRVRIPWQGGHQAGLYRSVEPTDPVAPRLHRGPQALRNQREPTT